MAEEQGTLLLAGLCRRLRLCCRMCTALLLLLPQLLLPLLLQLQRLLPPYAASRRLRLARRRCCYCWRHWTYGLHAAVILWPYASLGWPPALLHQLGRRHCLAAGWAQGRTPDSDSGGPAGRVCRKQAEYDGIFSLWLLQVITGN